MGKNKRCLYSIKMYNIKQNPIIKLKKNIFKCHEQQIKTRKCVHGTQMPRLQMDGRTDGWTNILTDEV